jgi:glycosyltransferase involved in cell wall biosynthesis
MRPTRVLITHVNMKFGGVETQLLALLWGIDRHRHEVHLALGRSTGERLHDIPPDVTVHELGHDARHGLSPMLAYKIRDIVQRVKPNLCVSYHAWTNAETYFAARSGRWKVGTVGSLPGEVIPGRMDFLRAFALRRMNAVCCVSHGVAASLVATYGHMPNVRVIPNCVDIDSVIAAAAEPIDHQWLVHKECPVLVTVCRLIPPKGVDLLLRAIQQLRTPVRLLIVGDGPERHRLQELSDRLGISDKVAFLGYQANPHRIVSRCDLFVFGSRSGEGLPTVLIEAMICGVPVITSAFPGVEDAVADGATGCVVPTRDEVLMAETIDRVLDSPGLRSALCQEAHARAVRDFSRELYVRRYEQLFQELANGTN